jgi:hypothetical protein
VNLTPEDLDHLRTTVREEVGKAIPVIVEQVVEALRSTESKGK